VWRAGRGGRALPPERLSALSEAATNGSGEIWNVVTSPPVAWPSLLVRLRIRAGFGHEPPRARRLETWLGPGRYPPSRASRPSAGGHTDLVDPRLTPGQAPRGSRVGGSRALPKGRELFVRLTACVQSLYLAYQSGPRPRRRSPAAVQRLGVLSQPNLTRPAHHRLLSVLGGSDQNRGYYNELLGRNANISFAFLNLLALWPKPFVINNLLG